MILGFIILGVYLVITFLFYRLFVMIIPDKKDVTFDNGFILDEYKRPDYAGMSIFWPVFVIGGIICVIIYLIEYGFKD